VTPVSEALPPVGQRVRCLLTDGQTKTLKLRDMPLRRGRCWQVKYALAGNIPFGKVVAWEPLEDGL